MSHYYVRNDGGSNIGTADGGTGGRYATAKTGTWASAFSSTSEYYSSIEAAFNNSGTAPVSGDIIYVASDHEKEYPTAGTLNSWASPNEDELPVVVISVDTGSVNHYLRGAQESCNFASSEVFVFAGSISFLGIDFLSDRGCVFQGSILAYQCLFLVIEAGRIIDVDTAGQAILVDCDIEIDGTTTGIWIGQGARFYWLGGTFTYTTTEPNILFYGYGDRIGACFVDGVDFSTFTGTLIASNATNDQDADWTFCYCKMSASLTSFGGPERYIFGGRTNIYGCGGTSAEAEYQFFQNTRGCTMTSTIAMWRDESLAFPSGLKVSALIETSAYTSITSPVYFDLPVKLLPLSDDTNYPTLYLYFQCDSGTVLNDGNFWAEVIGLDNTTKNQPRQIYNRADDPIATSFTAWVDDSGSSTWKDGTQPTGSDETGKNEYRMHLDLTGVGMYTLKDQYLIIRLWVGIPNLSGSSAIVVDTTVEAAT